MLTFALGTTVYTTFENPAEISPGMIVALPDGRAGEVTAVYDPGAGPSLWIDVRAWDGCMSYAHRAAELQPWIEQDARRFNP